MKPYPPVIVIGMHRSGTSMITGLLKQLGLFIGRKHDRHNEAIFFVKRNKKILNACNGGWDNPTMAEPLLNCSGMRSNLCNLLRKDVSSPKTISYLEFKRYIRQHSLTGLNFPWGWKDPRNTVTLPLWLDVFPEAKVIHIYRNGVDVAQSLAVREKKRIDVLLKNNTDISKKMFRQRHLAVEGGFKNHTQLVAKKIIQTVKPLSKYADYRISPSVSREYGFELWTYYVKKAFEYSETRHNQFIHIKYEDMVSRPRDFLKTLNHFCGFSDSSDEKKLKKAAAGINSKRRYAFKKDEDLSRFYERKKESCWMKKLGYRIY